MNRITCSLLPGKGGMQTRKVCLLASLWLTLFSTRLSSLPACLPLHLSVFKGSGSHPMLEPGSYPTHRLLWVSFPLTRMSMQTGGWRSWDASYAESQRGLTLQMFLTDSILGLSLNIGAKEKCLWIKHAGTSFPAPCSFTFSGFRNRGLNLFYFIFISC